MITLTKFCEVSHIDADLIRAVVRQFGGWDSFKESAIDVANNSIDGGFHGFIYYRDTVTFTRRNKAAILKMARDMAADFGEGSEYKLIAGFNCLKISEGEAAEAVHNARSVMRDTVYNALAWFAGEEVCRSYSDLKDYRKAA